MAVEIFRNWLDGRRVLVTGHTGFKGSWLTLWLSSLGAKVTGLSLPPDQGEDAIFDRAEIARTCDSRFGDIRDYSVVENVIDEVRPEFVFHLAAQALVRPAYADPLGTFATNVMGTAHVLEAARKVGSVRALVCVTTDKVYRNRETSEAFTEDHELGGSDPYSASKAAAEMVARAYMHTLIAVSDDLELATARGGNVVGGGDWSKDRIIPDIIRAWRSKQPLVLRSPNAIRPWQHVLELCFGYMMLAYRLDKGRDATQEGRHDFRGEWNFGPETGNEITVLSLVQGIVRNLGEADYPIEYEKSELYESTYLRLNSSHSKAGLGWCPLLDIDETIEWTVKWYKDYQGNVHSARELMLAQIGRYGDLISENIQV
jgi:CDP-glucose 4,6-dehydratase